LNPWQRGTSFAAIATGVYCADRFNYVETGAGVVTITKDADAPTVAEALIFTSHSLKVDVTTADASVAAGDLAYVNTKIEGYDFAAIAQRAFTLSFWVKATKTGIHCVSFRNSVADRSYIAEYTVDVTDTWEKKTVNVSASPSAGTWDYINGIGLTVDFSLAVGTTFHTTKDAWQTGDFLGTSSIVNDLDNIANNFQIALVQVEAGSAATPFEIRSREQELALCQRYFQKTFNQGVTPATGVGTSGAATYRATKAGASSSSANFGLSVPMRASPAMTYYNPVTANTKWYNSATAADSGAATTLTTGGHSIVVRNAQAAGDAVNSWITIHYTATAEL